MIYEFAATQDLHGWEKPWAPGANINILDPAFIENSTYYKVNNDGSIEVLASDIRAWATLSALEFPAGTYCISADMGIDNVFTQVRTSIDDYESVIYLSTYSSSRAVTFENDGGIKIKAGIGAASYPITVKIQLESGSEASAWTPYSNVCMPEGFNIWDPYNDEFIQVYAGYVNANTRELYLRPVYEEYAGEELVGPWMSSLDPYAEDTTPTEGAFVIDFGGELTSFEITPFMLQTLLDSLGIRQHFTDGAGLLNSLMDLAQGRVRSEEELLHLSRPLKVIAIGDQLPAGITIKPISKDVLPGLPGKFIR